MEHAKQMILDANTILGGNVDFWPQKDRVRAAEIQHTEVKFWNNSGNLGETFLPWARVSKGRIS